MVPSAKSADGLDFAMHRLFSPACMALLTAGVVHAAPLVPVEEGLAPVRREIAMLESEQAQLNKTLQAADASAADCAGAYERYTALEVEKRQLKAELEKAEEMARSGLVMYLR